MGAGPIAGPLYACAVSLRPNALLPLVRDSKLLKARQRQDALDSILDGAARAWSCKSTVDLKPTIEQARLRLMMLCVVEVQQMVEDSDTLVVVDGDLRLPLPPRYRQTALVKGDQRCLEVACASIIAKVLRDQFMQTLAQQHPEYGFEQNKGYATQNHIRAVLKYGLTPHHRLGACQTAITNYLAKTGK